MLYIIVKKNKNILWHTLGLIGVNEPDKHILEGKIQSGQLYVYTENEVNWGIRKVFLELPNHHIIWLREIRAYYKDIQENKKS